jgi:hypothetical protein
MGLCSNNCPTHKGGVYLFPHTHRAEAKRTIKIKKPPKKYLKTKRREKKSAIKNRDK